MLKNQKNKKEAQDAMLSLLPTCGTLAGIGIGLVGIMNAGQRSGATTVADDILLMSSLGFLICCYLIFFAMRHIESAHAPRMMQLIDVVFLLALTLIVFSGFVVVYELM